MIKSIKLANSYPTSEVGFIAKDLSNIYNFEFNTTFSIVILNSFFEELLKDNSVKKRVDSLLQNINENTDQNKIQEISETIIESIDKCTLSDKLKEDLDDAYETLPWESSSSAKDLLNKTKHKVNIIGSPNYVTSPKIFFGVEKNSLEEEIKEIYKHYFSIKEINYRLSSGIDQKFSIAIIVQKEELVSATALCTYSKKEQDSLIRVFVFPGLINIKDVEQPEKEVRPDQYIVIKDSLKLKSSIAGKQTFKNISDNGKYKRVECQIKNFILNDAIAIELARLTKKASVLLEKDVQIIFTITNDSIRAMHVSNTIDLQNDYYKKTSIENTPNFSEEKEEPIEQDNQIPEDEIEKEEHETEVTEDQLTEDDKKDFEIGNQENTIGTTEENKIEQESTEETSNQETVDNEEPDIVIPETERAESKTQEVQTQPNTDEFNKIVNSDTPLNELIKEESEEEKLVDIEKPELPEEKEDNNLESKPELPEEKEDNNLEGTPEQETETQTYESEPEEKINKESQNEQDNSLLNNSKPINFLEDPQEKDSKNSILDLDEKPLDDETKENNSNKESYEDKKENQEQDDFLI